MEDNLNSDTNNLIEELDFDFSADFFTEKPIDEEKLIRMEVTKENKLKFMELAKKEKRKCTREKRKENRKKILNSQTKEERIKNSKEKEKLLIQYEENLKRGLESEYKFIFDLDYNHLMKTRELKSLASQISYCYYINKKNPTPFRYIITNYTGEAKFELESMGSKNWYAKFYEEKFGEIDEIVNSGKEIIYLSPDSSNVLTEINKDSIYVIGGFVDKPVSKYRSLDRATGMNIKTARLPLEEHLDGLANPVLNINTVIEIIAKYLEVKDWNSVIKELIPIRMMNKK
jgi:tRNA (guanine9-N1)-methyltransferase